MGRIKILENVIRHYSWGSFTAIPELLNISSPADLPCAELWMGAHPAAPSRVIHDGRRVPLDYVIDRYPEEILGQQQVTGKFGNKLPFLFKVLAAARPLSIQAHPDINQAGAGYLRENQAGIPLDAPERNYKDPNHKPECLCALTPFLSLCGFRNLPDIIDNFSALLPDYSRNLTAELTQNHDGKGLRAFSHRLLTTGPDLAHDIIVQAVDRARERVDADPMCRWMIRLSQDFPGDIMALAPLFLNLVELSPQQAIFLPAGVLHSYLEGVGVELMANSDNVLRGGLTSKHVDVDELLDILQFVPMMPRVLSPVPRGQCEEIYETKAREFLLSVFRLMPGKVCSSGSRGRVAILLCVDGEAMITEQENGEKTALSKGVSVIIPASVESWSLSGDALIYKATVPF